VATSALSYCQRFTTAFLQLCEADAVTLDKVCRQHGVKLLLLRSYGLCGYVRPSVTEQCVIESKPDSTVDDLR
jgi:hypothetical protein